MKRIPLVVLLVFLCIQPVYSQKQVEIMQPKVEFDIKMASDMLNDGDAGIAGVVYYEKRTPIGIKVGETIYGRLGAVVTLYPLTPYIEEYLSLRKKNKEGKRIATISRVASCFRIESKVYGVKGEFGFRGLKPGK